MEIMADLNETFQPGMCYVILSRIVCLEQLFLKKFDPDKIYCNEKAKAEALRLKEISLNNVESEWDTETVLKISTLNVRSLEKHSDDLENDTFLNKSQILCLNETWLTNERNMTANFSNYPYKHYLNRRSKGVALLSKIEPLEICEHSGDLCSVIKATYPQFDLFCVYKFAGTGNVKDFTEVIVNMLDLSRDMVICGDMNVCVMKEPKNHFTATLERLGFVQKVTSPTHRLGGALDHMYVYSPRLLNCDERFGVNCSVKIHPLYFSDHDAVCLILKVNSNT